LQCSTRVCVPWFVLCMIPAWVYALPVVVCVARRVAVPSGSGSPACAGGGGSPSRRRGVYSFGSASAGSEWTPAMACGRCVRARVPEACVCTLAKEPRALVVKPAPHKPNAVLYCASAPCGSCGRCWGWRWCGAPPPPPPVVSLQEAEAARVAAAAQADAARKAAEAEAARKAAEAEAARKAAEAEAARKAVEAATALTLVCMPPPKHGMRRASPTWCPFALGSCYA
jgi:hypothetical protein